MICNVPEANNKKILLGWVETPLKEFVHHNIDSKYERSFVSVGRVLSSVVLPKKVIKKALNCVLKEKIKEDKLIIIEGMDKLEISTNKLNKKLASKNINQALFGYNEEYINFLMSLRNLYNFKSLFNTALNVYDILHYDYLLLDRESFNKIKEAL